MTQGGIGPAGEVPVALPPRAGRRTTLGKIGLAVSLVPWAVVGAFVLLQPG